MVVGGGGGGGLEGIDEGQAAVVHPSMHPSSSLKMSDHRMSFQVRVRGKWKQYEDR